MKERDTSAQRLTVRVIATLVVVLTAIAWWLIPAEEPVGQMGLARLLQEESQWRLDAFDQGQSINRFELWEIQEEIALRADITPAGVKGLARRAANAADTRYKAEGQLLAGNLEVANTYFQQLIDSAPTIQVYTADDVARWHQRRADAFWRGGFGDTANELKLALKSAPAENDPLTRTLLGDLALWHWDRATFRPESPAQELSAALAAIDAWLRLSEGGTAASLTAAHRLRGQILLRHACLPDQTDPGTLLAESLSAFDTALTHASAEKDPNVWAALHHDRGRALLQQLPGTGTEETVTAFQKALAERPAKVASGMFVDVRRLERDLNHHIETASCLAYALSLMPDPDAEAITEQTTSVLNLVVADDPGYGWLLARMALLRLDLHRGVTPETLQHATAALRHYPLDQIGEPGVPTQIQLLQLIGQLLQRHAAATGDAAPALADLRSALTDAIARLTLTNDTGTLAAAQALLESGAFQ